MKLANWEIFPRLPYLFPTAKRASLPFTMADCCGCRQRTFKPCQQEFYRERGCDINPQCPRHISKFFFLVRHQLLQCATSSQPTSPSRQSPTAMVTVTVSHLPALLLHRSLPWTWPRKQPWSRPGTRPWPWPWQSRQSSSRQFAMDTNSVTATAKATFKDTATDTSRTLTQPRLWPWSQ